MDNMLISTIITFKFQLTEVLQTKGAPSSKALVTSVASCLGYIYKRFQFKAYISSPQFLSHCIYDKIIFTFSQGLSKARSQKIGVCPHVQCLEPMFWLVCI